MKQYLEDQTFCITCLIFLPISSNPSNYQHTLQLLGVLKDAALNGIPWCPYTFARNIIIIVFFLDHITKLVHVNPVRQGMGGGRGTLCPQQIFLFIVGASGILRKPLTKSKKPMVKRVKLEIVSYTIFISTFKFEL